MGGSPRRKPSSAHPRVYIGSRLDTIGKTINSTTLFYEVLKRKKHRQSFDYQCFFSVGVTGFEPATTRPPDNYCYSTDNADYLLVTYLLLLFGLIVGLITA